MSVAWKSGGHPMGVALAGQDRGARSGLGTLSRAPRQLLGQQTAALSIHAHPRSRAEVHLQLWCRLAGARQDLSPPWASVSPSEPKSLRSVAFCKCMQAAPAYHPSPRGDSSVPKRLTLSLPGVLPLASRSMSSSGPACCQSARTRYNVT